MGLPVCLFWNQTGTIVLLIYNVNIYCTYGICGHCSFVYEALKIKNHDIKFDISYDVNITTYVSTYYSSVTKQFISNDSIIKSIFH